MSELIHALNRILNWLKNNPSEKYASVDVLQPGLSYEEIDRRVADLPFKLPEEVYQLYQWKNGTCDGEEDFSKFFNGYTFLSLEAAINEYEDKNWKSYWFPIFYLDSRDYFVLLYKSENVAPISRIYLGGGEDEEVLFSSLTNMMLLIAKSYESKDDSQINKPTASYFYQMSSSHQMTELTNALDRILIYLEKYENLNHACFESLQLGLSYEEIIEKTKHLPFCLPREVVELYRWGNGTWEEEEAYGRFFNNYTFLSLELALEIYYSYLNDGFNWSETKWNTQWIPIMEDMDEYGVFAIVLNQQQTDTTPVLDIFWEDFDGEPDIIYPSLSKMIQAEAEIYEAGYYLLNKNRELDYEAVRYIRHKYQEIPMKVWREED